MKRKDAFRKLHAICRRLDEVDPATFHVRPLRLYLFGSVLTDKPDPNDINLVLTYDHTPDFDAGADAAAMVNGLPTAIERLIIHLRRGKEMVRIDAARRSLDEWMQREVFLATHARLVWQPGADWAAVLDQIEASPRYWPGPLTPEVLEMFNASIKKLSKKEREARLARAITEIERQDLPNLAA